MDFFTGKMTSDAKSSNLNLSNTYVIRPKTDFGSERDENYLEKHYPDLFPFGRGGFGERRRKQISRSSLLNHLLNLSTRQFQQPDFLLPLYDMKTRIDVAKLAFVRSILPPRELNQHQITTRAEAYGRIRSEDLQLACTYKIDCAKAASQGLPYPPAPLSLNGLSMDFFTDMSLSTKPMQHSQAAANGNRQDVYAAHNSNGKAQIWFTVSPADNLVYKIVWYAIGQKDAEIHEKRLPSGDFRFKLLAKHPVAAALYFERLLEIVIERIVGWNKKKSNHMKVEASLEFQRPGFEL